MNGPWTRTPWLPHNPPPPSHTSRSTAISNTRSSRSLAVTGSLLPTTFTWLIRPRARKFRPSFPASGTSRTSNLHPSLRVVYDDDRLDWDGTRIGTRPRGIMLEKIVTWSSTELRLRAREVQTTPTQLARWDCDKPGQQYGRQRVGLGAVLRENELEPDRLGHSIQGGESPKRCCHGVWK